jgi:hypothetical protein
VCEVLVSAGISSVSAGLGGVTTPSEIVRTIA